MKQKTEMEDLFDKWIKSLNRVAEPDGIECFEAGWHTRDEQRTGNTIGRTRDHLEILDQLERIDEKLGDVNRHIGNAIQDEREGKCWTTVEADLWQQWQVERCVLEAKREALWWVIKKWNDLT